MRKLAILAGLALASVLATTRLSAQADTHHGFYASVGVGYGAQTTSFEFDGESDGSDSFMATTWYAQAGWGIRPKWSFGVEANYLKGSCEGCGGDYHNTITFYSAVATWYPNTMNNFFVKLNLGYGSSEYSYTGEGSTTEGGFGGGLGLGYDWAIGKGGFIIKPFANYLTQFSSATYSGALGDGEQGRAQLIQIGIGLGYKH